MIIYAGHFCDNSMTILHHGTDATFDAIVVEHVLTVDRLRLAHDLPAIHPHPSQSLRPRAWLGTPMLPHNMCSGTGHSHNSSKNTFQSAGITTFRRHIVAPMRALRSAREQLRRGARRSQCRVATADGLGRQRRCISHWPDSR